jgi:hypothetical protein
MKLTLAKLVLSCLDNKEKEISIFILEELVVKHARALGL